ncbi:MAG: hypothetical protein AB1646_24915 [Thermodesulfobacteriota bacterium]
MRIALVLALAIGVLACSLPAFGAATATIFDDHPVFGKMSAHDASMSADEKKAGESIGTLCAKKSYKKKRRSKKRNGKTRRSLDLTREQGLV